MKNLGGHGSLARPIGPDNAGYALADGDFGLIGEGFEALDFQFFQAHEVVLPFDSVWT